MEYLLKMTFNFLLSRELGNRLNEKILIKVESKFVAAGLGLNLDAA